MLRDHKSDVEKDHSKKKENFPTVFTDNKNKECSLKQTFTHDDSR